MIRLGYGCAATRAAAHITVARTTKSATAFMGHQHGSRPASAAAVTLSRSLLVRNPARVLLPIGPMPSNYTPLGADLRASSAFRSCDHAKVPKIQCTPQLMPVLNVRPYGKDSSEGTTDAVQGEGPPLFRS